jgi:phthalate 4,5-dioxygenase
LHFRKLVRESARALQQGQDPTQLAHPQRYAVRSGACVTNKAKDLLTVMVERFGEETGYVGRPRIAAAE